MVDMKFLKKFEGFMEIASKQDEGPIREFYEELLIAAQNLEWIAEYKDYSGCSYLVGLGRCFQNSLHKNPYKIGDTIEQCINSSLFTMERKSISKDKWYAIGLFDARQFHSRIQIENCIVTTSFVSNRYLLNIEVHKHSTIYTAIVLGTKSEIEKYREYILSGKWTINTDNIPTVIGPNFNIPFTYTSIGDK